MKNLGTHIGVLLILSAGLSACEIAMHEEIAVIEEEAVEVVEETAFEVEPELPSLFFKWDISQSNIISAPIEVRTAAIAACQERGFDTGDMINLSISGKIAEAEFGCRGAD